LTTTGVGGGGMVVMVARSSTTGGAVGGGGSVKLATSRWARSDATTAPKSTCRGREGRHARAAAGFTRSSAASIVAFSTAAN
jgi:hypothetical protein